MSEPAAVPLIVLSRARDNVEALNGMLRRGGIPAHCTWIPALQDLPDAIAQLDPELLLCIGDDDALVESAARVRDEAARELPLVVIRQAVDEDVIAADLERGARDTVTFRHATRLQAVVQRELRAHRLERALNGTLQSAQDYRRQLESVLTRSNDAIAQVQEGILVDANASWLELIGAADASAVLGQPIMDFFDEASHPALKGALIGCLKGRWNDHGLKVDVLVADGSAVPLEVVLSLGERDGEPCVRLIVPAQKRDDRHLARDLADAVQRNPRTGLLRRQPLLEALKSRVETPVQGGGRFLACIRPDHYAKLEGELGVFANEEFIVAFASLVKSQLHPNDLLGHYTGAGLLALVERGTQKDAEAWAEHLVELVGRQVFHAGDKSVQATVSVGLCVLPNTDPDLGAVIGDAISCAIRGEQRGGNKLSTIDRTLEETRSHSYDAIWVKHIRAALMENRFRLVQQPIASLQGDDTQMYDVLVRMLDSEGKEVLPSEFMPAAERSDLLKNIDRWVIGAAFGLAIKRKPSCLFIRLSRGSAQDPTLVPWLDSQLKATNLESSRICFQLTEEIASQYVQDATRLSGQLHDRGFRFAIDHFGVGRDPAGLMAALPLDFVKVDGSLMQGLTKDELLQRRVLGIVDAARARGIATIAERVEDANTMAVLWQLGVQHLQGYFIQTPERVVLEGR